MWLCGCFCNRLSRCVLKYSPTPQYYSKPLPDWRESTTEKVTDIKWSKACNCSHFVLSSPIFSSYPVLLFDILRRVLCCIFLLPVLTLQQKASSRMCFKKVYLSATLRYLMWIYSFFSLPLHFIPWRIYCTCDIPTCVSQLWLLVTFQIPFFTLSVPSKIHISPSNLLSAITSL